MQHSSRYLVGIDLGTTNCVLAYADTEEGPEGAIRVFPVPQLVAPGEVQALPELPSFLYFPTEDERLAGTLSLPWDEHAQCVVGVWAREQGALLPARQVASAKSWLSHGGVNRRSPILPRQAEPPEPMVSPVEASARYLRHLCHAWNHTLAGGAAGSLLENQEVVLTVPASFDEEARELTVEAASAAGLSNFILLEEPLAAFYAWIADHRQELQAQLRDGDLVLICDIGGGTTDFSLVRARAAGEGFQFERTAIGEHLLLGGDNLDLALAYRLAERLPGGQPGLRQRLVLKRLCCHAKERLLSGEELESLPITVMGAGSGVVGQAMRAVLTRAEVAEILTSGFLPLTAADERPSPGTPQSRTAGLRELELPYAGDPAITKHLAAFLAQAAQSMKAAKDPSAIAPRESTIGGGFALDSLDLARPDAILFNGGFCTPAIARERVAEAVAGWFSPESRDSTPSQSRASSGPRWRPKVLPTTAMENAVAKGAAYYGSVRRSAGIRIRAGSARTYYAGLRSEQRLHGVCVLPAGVEEGTTLPLSNREFAVLANRPVSFTLYSSRLRHDAHGQVTLLEGEDVHRHAPLVTLLRYGKKLRELELAVRLRVDFTAMGTLELWCEAVNSPHRWRLQFELRGDEGQLLQSERTAGTLQSPAAQRQDGSEEDSAGQAMAATPTPSMNLVLESTESAVALLRTVFSETPETHPEKNEAEAMSPETLIARLESGLGAKRERWPPISIRKFADVLLELSAGRKLGPRYEVRWVNLLGLCLRPGFGAPGDETRVRQARQLYLNGPAFPEELQSEAEWLVFWRRVAGGLNASQQQELYRQLAETLGLDAKGKKKSGRLNRQVEREGWRLLASLEHLPATRRAYLGTQVLAKLRKDPADSAWLWPLARLGARVPLYGPLDCVVTPETAAAWLASLLEFTAVTPETAYAISVIGRCTGDAQRDLDAGLRERAIEHLSAAGIGEELMARLRSVIPPEASEGARMFGEPLPPGLNLVTTPHCLLSVPALASGVSQKPASPPAVPD
jgi:hypothetical protein